MKIVCSIGPNIKSVGDLDRFVKAGMDYMRLNFSHGDYDKFKKLITHARNKYPKINIIQDLQGNKLRVSALFKGQLRVNPGDEVYFCSEAFYKANLKLIEKYTLIPIAIDGEFSLLTGCTKVLMKDGTMIFKTMGNLKNEEAIKAQVVVGGIVRGEKGLNVPEIDRTAMGLTLKDKKDIEFGLLNGVDVMCLSYTTCKENIEELKAYIETLKKYNPQVSTPRIWAKIECEEAIENFDEILENVDGIMLGRGDLLSEIDIIEIPFVQSKIIEKMKSSEKELIIATYILDSMKNSSMAKIPEVDDIYNFIINKVDGVMLAGEVGVGRNPIETITLTKRIITKYSNK